MVTSILAKQAIVIVSRVAIGRKSTAIIRLLTQWISTFRPIVLQPLDDMSKVSAIPDNKIVWVTSKESLGVTFDPHLSFSNYISNLSRSCFMHIRDLRRI